MADSSSIQEQQEVETTSTNRTESNVSDFVPDKYGFTGGTLYTNPDENAPSFEQIQQTRKRELKWIKMFDNWDVWMQRRFQQTKRRCRKGIPSSLRGRAWQLLSGGKWLLNRNKGKYENLISSSLPETITDDIDKDLHRQFPFHEMFAQRGGLGQQDLRNVLHAYAAYNKEDGYCQAQAPVAAVLLMHMPAEEAFWCMVAVFFNYIPGYYSPGLEVVQIDGNILQGLLKLTQSSFYDHLEKCQIVPMLYCQEWFMCVFARTLPWASTLRVWDMFFCEGVKVLFRCGLVLIRSALKDCVKAKSPADMYDTLEAFKKINPGDMQPESLIPQIITQRITDVDLQRVHKAELKRWNTERGKAPPSKISDRMYTPPSIVSRKGFDAKSSMGMGSTMTLSGNRKLHTLNSNAGHIIAQGIIGSPNISSKKRSKEKVSPVTLTRYVQRSDDDKTVNNGLNGNNVSNNNTRSPLSSRSNISGSLSSTNVASPSISSRLSLS